MAANQKSDDFQIEDWAIPEDELPWNAPAAATAAKPTQSRFQAANVIELNQYRRLKNKSHDL
jgi:hypothetical protein